MACVPGCHGNYKDNPKMHALKFPKDLCIKWVTAITRMDFSTIKHNRD